jgi:heat shock protein HspQ
MKEIFDIIRNSLTFVNIYYKNFTFQVDDSIDIKINKLIMLMIYTTGIFILIRSEYIAFPIALIIILLIFKMNYIKERFETVGKCRKPTINKPFMNVLFEADENEACDVSEKEILDKYNHNLNRNIKDLFNKKTGQLYYRTNNVTSIPNKYKDFLNFIGRTNDQLDNNCKYDGVNCLKYNDLRIR